MQLNLFNKPKKMRKGKRKGHKVGQSWTTTRKLDGKRRKVKITKTSTRTYSVKRVGKK